MDLLIHMDTMLTILLSMILSFTTLMIIPMMKITTSELTVGFTMQLPYRTRSTILSHMELFKYNNDMFNLNNVTTV